MLNQPQPAKKIPTKTLELPEKLQGLLVPKRYKVIYGGRGGGKSWGIAIALLLMAAQKKLRVLCAREFQNSIADSVHKLFSDKIAELGLSEFYDVQQKTIVGKNGSEFLFTGLRHNASKLKSFESVNICWVEEAANVSKTSWETLVPTIRAADSEIWISFNPVLEEDETYQRFVIAPPADSWVIRMNYDENPWFPKVLRREMESLKERDVDAYHHVWLGHCRQTLEGAVYANELRDAKDKNRIMNVPYMGQYPVSVYFDLGYADHTSAWFVQKVGFEYHIIKAYQNRQLKWEHYLQFLQSCGYVYDVIWLPHDARAKSLGTGMSIEEMTRNAGFNVRIVPNLSVEEGINAARTIFPQVYFDEANCADGLQSMRRYRYDVNTDSGLYSKKPVHDETSHFADAFRYFAVGSSQKITKYVPKLANRSTTVSRFGFNGSNNGWMR